MKMLIIVPCYNEEKRLPHDEFLKFLEIFEDLSFLFVDDGSSDNTFSLLDSLSKKTSRIKTLKIESNQGKAEAIRQAMLSVCEQKEFSYLGYIDADLATPLDQLLYFSQILNSKKEVLCVLGSRVGLLGRKIERKWYRHYLGRIFATLASTLLKISVYDTQCGAKLFRSHIVTDLFKEKFLTRWLFDLEIFWRMKKLLPNKDISLFLYEFPVTSWRDVNGSRLKFLDFLKAPYELFKLYFHYRD